MSFITIHTMNHSGILRLYSDRDSIDLHPEYQRNGDIWTREKKQLFIDSILNEYDIPKLYLHRLAYKTSSQKEYAVIDGRQRLETIWGFIDGSFELDDNFKYLKNEDVNAKGFTYDDLAKNYPKLKTYFDAYVLPIVVVETDDLALVDDMFYRLNEAVSLNAPEKRNAIGGHVVRAINLSCKNNFFVKKVRFSNNRYQHKEVVVRLLFLTNAIIRTGKLMDTKKTYLDKFARDYRSKRRTLVKQFSDSCEKVLGNMNQVFIDKDSLLSAQGIVPIYYLLFFFADQRGQLDRLSRQKFEIFKELLQENRQKAEEGIADADFGLLEFDRLSQQGTNDASSIVARLRTISSHLGMPIDLYKELDMLDVSTNAESE